MSIDDAPGLSVRRIFVKVVEMGEIKKHPLTFRGKNIDEIKFIVDELNADEPGRYLIFSPPKNRNMFAILFGNCKSEYYTYNHRAEKYEFDCSGIRIEQTGDIGCKGNFFLTEDDWPIIKDDYKILKERLGFRGGPKIVRRGRKSRYSEEEKRDFYERWNRIKEFTTMAEFIVDNCIDVYDESTVYGWFKKFK